jgi:hypothetical protein
LFQLSVDQHNAMTCDVNVIDIEDTRTRTKVKRETSTHTRICSTRAKVTRAVAQAIDLVRTRVATGGARSNLNARLRARAGRIL